jgi:hypothetical protein
MNHARSHIDCLTRICTTWALIVLAGSLLHAQDTTALRNYWSFGTSYLMPHHKWESGIAQPFRYGLSEKYEIHSNALELPVFPNIGIKIAQGFKNSVAFASDHVISYPTVFMNAASSKGTGGLISPQYYIPSIISIYNAFMATKPIGSSAFLTAFLGYSFAIRSSKPDPMATIDLPLVYPRMAHYYEGSTFRLGMTYKSSLGKKWLYEDGFEIFYVTRPDNNFFFENTGSLMWVMSRTFRIKGGYSLSYGRYPYGTMWQLWPAIDFVFGSKI